MTRKCLFVGRQGMYSLEVTNTIKVHTQYNWTSFLIIHTQDVHVPSPLALSRYLYGPHILQHTVVLYHACLEPVDTITLIELHVGYNWSTTQ